MRRPIRKQFTVVLFTAPDATRHGQIKWSDVERCLAAYDPRYEWLGWSRDGQLTRTYTVTCATGFDALLLQQYLLRLWPFLFGDAPVEITLADPREVRS